MSRSEGQCLGYGPPCDSFKATYYALPPKIGCADMPRGAAMPDFPYSKWHSVLQKNG